MNETHSSEQITPQEVAKSIGWLDRLGETGIEFDTADWSLGDGTVVIEGRKGDYYVRAVVKVIEVLCDYSPYYEDDWDLPDDEEEDDDA